MHVRFPLVTYPLKNHNNRGRRLLDEMLALRSGAEGVEGIKEVMEGDFCILDFHESSGAPAPSTLARDSYVSLPTYTQIRGVGQHATGIDQPCNTLSLKPISSESWPISSAIPVRFNNMPVSDNSANASISDRASLPATLPATPVSSRALGTSEGRGGAVMRSVSWSYPRNINRSRPNSMHGSLGATALVIATQEERQRMQAEAFRHRIDSLRAMSTKQAEDLAAAEVCRGIKHRHNLVFIRNIRSTTLIVC